MVTVYKEKEKEKVDEKEKEKKKQKENEKEKENEFDCELNVSEIEPTTQQVPKEEGTKLIGRLSRFI